ncbi:hypothetical protein CLF_111527 [Clonorchis sinensis]|uniref:Uncharacterized protein n=1 Tax=Clonorchis sinensis TaxID=79923 RepID=G7YLQ5_CLOSI|nr:hypothetical protein CLF_111527 [Clonorchis sinensis]
MIISVIPYQIENLGLGSNNFPRRCGVLDVPELFRLDSRKGWHLSDVNLIPNLLVVRVDHLVVDQLAVSLFTDLGDEHTNDSSPNDETSMLGVSIHFWWIAVSDDNEDYDVDEEEGDEGEGMLHKDFIKKKKPEASFVLLVLRHSANQHSVRALFGFPKPTRTCYAVRRTLTIARPTDFATVDLVQLLLDGLVRIALHRRTNQAPVQRLAWVCVSQLEHSMRSLPSCELDATAVRLRRITCNAVKSKFKQFFDQLVEPNPTSPKNDNRFEAKLSDISNGLCSSTCLLPGKRLREGNTTAIFRTSECESVSECKCENTTQASHCPVQNIGAAQEDRDDLTSTSQFVIFEIEPLTTVYWPQLIGTCFELACPPRKKVRLSRMVPENDVMGNCRHTPEDDYTRIHLNEFEFNDSINGDIYM